MGQINSVAGDGPSAAAAAAGANLAAGLRSSALLQREREEREGSPQSQGEGNSQSVRTAIDIYIENCLNSNNEHPKEESGRRSSSEPSNLSSARDSGDSTPAVTRSNTVTGFSKYLLNKMQDGTPSVEQEKGASSDRDEEVKPQVSEVKTEVSATTGTIQASTQEDAEKDGVKTEVKPKVAAEVKTETVKTEGMIKKEVVEIKTEAEAGEDKDEGSSDHIEIVDVEKMTPPASPGKTPKLQPGVPPVKLEKSPVEDKGSLPKHPVFRSSRDSGPFNCQSIPLQVIIDRVLDTSLGEDSSLPNHPAPPVSTSSPGPLTVTREGLPKLSSASGPEQFGFASALSRTPSTKPQDRGSDSAREAKNNSMKVEGKNVVFLMDHIERVLEHSFANHDSQKNNDSEEEGGKVSSTSSTSSAATVSRSRSPLSAPAPAPVPAPAPAPVPVPVPAPAPTASASSSSSKGIHEGSISVQDIVDRVISQTEVISKCFVPPSSASSIGSESKYMPSSVTTTSASSRPSPTERVHPPAGGVPRQDLLHPESRHYREEDKGYRSAFSPGSHSMRHHMSSRVEESRDTSHPYRVDHPLGYKSDLHPVVGSPNGVAWLPHMAMPLPMVPYSAGDVSKSLMSPSSYFKMPGHPSNRQPPPLIRGDKLHEMPPHPPTKGCFCHSCTMAAASGEALHATVGQHTLGVHRSSTHSLSQHSKHHAYPPHASLSPYSQPLHPSAQFSSQLMSAAAEKHSSSRDIAKSAVPVSHAKGPPSATTQRPLYPMPGITTGVPPRQAKAHQVPLMREMVEVPPHGSISRGEPVYHGQYLPYGPSSVSHAQSPFSGISSGRSRGSEPPSSEHSVPGGSSHSLGHPETVRLERKPEPILDLSVKGLPEPRSSPAVERAPDSYPDEQPLDLSKKPSSSSASAAVMGTGRGDSPYSRHPRKYISPEVKDSPHFQHLDSRVSPLPVRADPALLTPGVPGPVVLPAQQGEALLGAAVYPPGVDYPTPPPRGEPLVQQPRIPAHPPPFSTSPAISSFPPLEPTPHATAGREPDLVGKGTSSSPISRPPLTSGERQEGSSSSSGSASGNGKRTNVSRHEPLQNIIGSHPANDILFLRCLMCNQTYGSPYGFRKHFRNQHGFEPKAEHAEVASISAERSLRQGSDVTQDSPIPSDTNSHSPGTPDLVCGFGSGDDSVLKQDMNADLRQEGGAGKHKRSYSRGSEGRPLSAEDGASEDKCLRCQTCGQSFQLNDFGGFKRHNRQHNQSRTSGLYSCPECHLSLQDPMLLQEHIANAHRHRGDASSKVCMCKVCGERFSSSQEYEHHLMEAHNRRLYSCELCTANFSDSYEFEHHLQSTHGGQLQGGGGRLLDIQRLPADAVTTSASPDSSSDNASSAQEQQPSSNTPNLEGSRDAGPSKAPFSEGSMQSPAATGSPDTGSKAAREEVTTSKSSAGKEEEKEGESGRHSCSSSESRTQSCESNNDASSQPSPCGSDDPHPDLFYKHKKFALHRKRADSMDCDARSKKGDEKDSYDSSDSNSVSSCPERKRPRLDVGGGGKGSEGSGESQGVANGEKGASASSKERGQGEEGEEGEDSQQGVVWDRVTRSQAGKTIKRPDYMT